MSVQNFLSFGKAAFDFRSTGLTFVEGENLDDDSAISNGSGKSAMIDALVWCLFGITLRGYENDEVVHRKVGDDCLVQVCLEIDDEIYTISRARRHSKLKNSLRVTHDNLDEDMSGPSNTETQEVVEKLLGCSRRTFMSSVVFGQDRGYRFSSLTDKEQKEILDEVLGVERFAQACSEARSKATSIGIAVDNIQRDLDRAVEQRDQAAEEAEGLREKDASFESERKDKLKAERAKLGAAKEWIKKNAGGDTDKLKLEVERIVKLVTAMEKEVAQRNKDSTDVKVQRAGAKSKVDELRTAVKKQEAIAKDCPTCGQRVDEVQHERVLGDLKKKLAMATKTLNSIEDELEEVDEKLEAAQRKLATIRADASTAQKKLNDAVAESANTISWKRRVKDHEDRIAELEKENNPYDALARKVEAKCVKYGKEAALLSEQHTAEEARLKLAEFWVQAFGAKGLRSLLLDSSLPLLNEEAARISRAVTGGTIKVEFSATSELKSGKTVDKFEVRVDNKHGAATYLGNSAGERAKADLCVGLALQRLVASRSSASFNVCFFDEVFDHLDSAAHERVVDVLSEIDKESVFVVSHNDDLKAWFPAALRIVKKKGFSSVEA
jgi:DNA repair exonuclease SbcCD ATPase subunit